MMSHISLAPLPTRAGNAATIAAINTSVLPDGPARQALLDLARSGGEVYAYHPRNRETGWETPDNITVYLTPAYAEWDGRMTCAQWQAAYTLATESFRSDEDAVRTLAAHYSALWAAGYADGSADDLSTWRRPEGLDDLEHALSLLRWWLYTSEGREGLARFRALLGTTGQATPAESAGQEGGEA